MTIGSFGLRTPARPSRGSRRRVPTASSAKACLILAVAALVAGAAVPCGALSSSSAGIIERVAVDVAGTIDETSLIRVLGLEPGTPLDRRQIREAILALYAGGELEWIEVVSEPTQTGLDVTVRASLRSKISRIEVASGGPILRNQLKKWMGLQPGEPASAAKVEAGRRRVLRKLRERGHLDPRVDVYLDYRRSSNTVAVSIEAQPGPVQLLEAVKIEGVDDLEAAAAAQPKVKQGARLTARLEERVRREVEERLRRGGYWEARVVGVDRRATGATTELVARVDPGPSYRLEIDAPAELEKVATAAFPDPAQEDIHPSQTATLADRVRENLQSQGYLLASVAVELDADGPAHVLTVHVDPGQIRRIATVDFPGATSIDRDVLLDMVSVDRGATRGLLGTTVNDATLETDRRAVAEAYRSRGYVDVQVESPILEPAGEDEVRVLIPVEEGQQWFLDDVVIEGLPVEAAARLEETTLSLQEAKPWNPRAVEESQRQLEATLANSGYPEGRVTTAVDTSEPGRATVILTVEPGQYVEIGEVVIAGLRRTRRSVVARMLSAAGVESGAPYARSRLLEAQRRLYELGLFRTVELLPMPGQERRAVRGLVVHVEEGAQRSYLVGVGWNETDRWRLTLGWSHLNLFGGAHALSLEGRLSTNEERFQIGLREPRIPYLDEPGYLVIYRTFERFENRNYEQHRRGLWFDIGDRRKVPFRTWYRYEYQIVDPALLDEAPADPDLPREDVEAKIASITPTLEWDFRDDPLVPTRGSFSQISLEWAFPLFDANSEFLKFWGRSTLYGRHSHGTWAAGIRVGVIEPLGRRSELPANLQIPLNTRYFAGGSSTHRGFERDLLGIRGETLNEEGDPIGGNAVLLINLEYERPVSRLFSGVAFVDVGNVWAEPSSVRVSDLRWAAGLGLRVLTPAGPLRAEYGWKLDRQEGESKGEFFLSFGVPF